MPKWLSNWLEPFVENTVVMPSSRQWVDPPAISRRSLIAIRILSLAATAVAAYLAWITLTHGTLAACGDASPHIACGHVLRSSWSRWLGMPVSLFGCAVYLSMFLTSWWASPISNDRYRKTAWLILATLVLLAVGSALWFVFLQLFVIGKVCLFCTSIHLCGLVIAGLLFLELRRSRIDQQQAEHLAFLQNAATTGRLSAGSARSPHSTNRVRHRLLWPATMASCGLFLLVAGQIGLPSKTFEVHSADTFGVSAVAESAEEVVQSPDGPADGDRATTLAGDASASSGAIASASVSSAARSRAESHTSKAVPENPSQPGRSAPATSQMASPLSSTTPSRPISFLEGKLNLDVYQHGVLGSREAEHVIVELVDYTCPDCRKLHQHMQQARTRYGDHFAIVVLPVPLETSCNPYVQRTHPKHVGACKYASLALAVLSVDDDKFGEFHDWLMESESPPPFDEAYRHAARLVDPERLETEQQSDRVRRRLQTYTQLYEKIQRLPVLIIGNGIMVGVPANAKEFYGVLEKRLGMHPTSVPSE